MNYLFLPSVPFFMMPSWLSCPQSLEAVSPCVLSRPCHAQSRRSILQPGSGQLWLHTVLPGEGCGAGCLSRARALTSCVSLSQGKDMLTQKLPLWQQSCSDPNKIPERAIQLMQQMAASSNGTIMPSPLSTSKSNLIISDPIPGAKPLPVPPELAPFVGVSILVVEVVLPFRAKPEG